MKSNKNNLVLTTLQKANISNLKEEEIIKLANSIANNININGLRRHINSILIVVIEDKIKNNNQKLEIIQKILTNQKVIEKNVRNLKRKKSNIIDLNEATLFIKTTEETLKLINKYQVVKEENKTKNTEEENQTKTKVKIIKK